MKTRRREIVFGRRVRLGGDRPWEKIYMCTYLVVMVPENVSWRLGTELDDARQIDGAPFVYVYVRTSGYRS